MTQKLTRKLKNLGLSSSKALGSSTTARLSGIWGTRTSRTRRVMAMAKTASLKNTVRSISGPLSVQYSSDPLIRVFFCLANLYILDFQCPRRGIPYSLYCREGGVFETGYKEPVSR